MSMIKGAASTAGAKFTSSLGGWNDSPESVKQEKSGSSGQFDLFLLAQSWAPRFCCSNAAQCKRENMEGMDDLAIHGLWPAYNEADSGGRTYPAFCDRSDMASATSGSTLKGRAAHEWKKHGTCTTMSSTDYLTEEMRIADMMDSSISSIRDVLNNSAGDTVEVAQLQDEAGGPRRVALMTNQFCQLQEITTCWAKDAVSGRVGEQIDCPAHVLGSSRNSAVLQGCTRVALDQSGEQCAFISKEFLKILKQKT